MPDLPPPPEEPRDLPWPSDTMDNEAEASEEIVVAEPGRDKPPSSPKRPEAVGARSQEYAALADVEAERALLGAVLLNPDMYFEVANHVSAKDFTVLGHRHIWEAISSLMHQTTPALDVTVLAAELRRREVLDEVGGLAYLTELLGHVDRSLSAPHYARLVADYSLRRQLQAVAQEIVRLAHRTDLNGDAALEEAERLLFRITTARYRRDVEPLERVLEDLREHLEQLKSLEGVAGIPTGFRRLDTMLKGLQPSDLIIVAGRPGMGKTAFVIALAHNAALRGRRIAIFSLEMSNEQVAQRLLSQETGWEGDRFRDPRLLAPSQWQQLDQVIERLSELPIFLDDTPALTPQQLRVKCLRLQQQYGLDLVIVDYLQLMSGGRRSENRVQEVSYISRSLKNLARDLHVPVVAAAQLSRAVEQRADRRPMLSDLRESGALEQDADVVMFLYREKYYEQLTREDGERGPTLSSVGPETVELNIAKHRNGPTGKIELLFDPRYSRFQDAPVVPASAAAKADLNRPPPPPPPPPDIHGLTDDGDPIPL